MLLTFLIQLYSIKVERTLLFVLVEYYKERLIIITQIILSELFLCQTGVIQLYSIKVERTLLFVLVEYYKERLIIITQIILSELFLCQTGGLSYQLTWNLSLIKKSVPKPVFHIHFCTKKRKIGRIWLRSLSFAPSPPFCECR